MLLAAQYYTYQQYKTNAVSNGDVTVSNDRIYDVAGRNPYDTKTIFGVAPLKKQLQGNTFSFKLPSGLIYTNTSLTLSQVQMDFDDGNGYQTITLNTAKNVTYSSGGEKELKVKFVYSGGPTLYSHSKIWVDYIAPQGGPLARFSGNGFLNQNGTLWFNNPVTGNPWNGGNATGRITIELAPGHTQLTKPLIVVEGFDPDNRFNYFSLINSQEPGGLEVDLDPNPSNFYSLNEAIEDEGYDLVFIDYVNSTDYIQRNAYMVEEVIRQINQLKVGNEKNVVLGMSMGGLVARYALRDMEINSEIHDTKLYISHDAPHQGANVPLGFQALARHLYGEEISIPILLSLIDFDIVSLPSLVPDLNNGYNLLQSPAAQQMLTYQLQGAGANVSVNNNTLHDSFSTELSNMGYPQQNGIRNIAIANGSECGNPLGFNAYDTLVDVNETVDLPFFITNVALAFINLAGWNPLKSISSLLSTNTDIKVQVNVKALPNQESKQIYKGKIFIRKAVLGFIIIHEDLIDQKTLNSSSSMLPLDNANGGVYNIDTFVTLPPEFNSYVLEREFNFIPTFSSLDIGGGNQTINYLDLNKAYSPLSPPKSPKNTPFDNFFTNELSSEQHIQFTLNNGNWLIEELDSDNNQGFFSCASTDCTGTLNLKILGKENICGTNSEAYSVGNLSSLVNPNWSISPSGDFTLATTGNNIIVTPNSNFTGNATLRAIISTQCGDFFTLTKKIWIGKPKINNLPPGPGQAPSNTFCQTYNYEPQNSITVDAQGLDYGTSNSDWEWTPITNNFIYNTYKNKINIIPHQLGTIVFTVRVKNSCGWSVPAIFQYLVTDCGPGGGQQFRVSPNPATSTINISHKNTSSEFIKQLDDITQLKLYDFSSTVLIEKRNGSLKTLNISRLKEGIYYLEITSGDKTEVHKIVVDK